MIFISALHLLLHFIKPAFIFCFVLWVRNICTLLLGDANVSNKKLSLLSCCKTCPLVTQIWENAVFSYTIRLDKRAFFLFLAARTHFFVSYHADVLSALVKLKYSPCHPTARRFTQALVTADFTAKITNKRCVMAHFQTPFLKAIRDNSSPEQTKITTLLQRKTLYTGIKSTKGKKLNESISS